MSNCRVLVSFLKSNHLAPCIAKSQISKYVKSCVSKKVSILLLSDLRLDSDVKINVSVSSLSCGNVEGLGLGLISD